MQISFVIGGNGQSLSDWLGALPGVKIDRLRQKFLRLFGVPKFFDLIGYCTLPSGLIPKPSKSRKCVPVLYIRFLERDVCSNS